VPGPDGQTTHLWMGMQWNSGVLESPAGPRNHDLIAWCVFTAPRLFVCCRSRLFVLIAVDCADVGVVVVVMMLAMMDARSWCWRLWRCSS
jgi:hypothetical protein